MSIAPPAQKYFIESLRSRIVEGRTMNPYQFRPVVVPLQVTLNATSPQGQATFIIPSNQRMLLLGFTPHIVPVTLSNPLDGSSGVYNVGVPGPGDVLAGGTLLDVLYAKALNCRVSLKLVTSTFDLFPQMNFALSDLMSLNGENPSMMDMPGILLQGSTMTLTAALQDTSVAAAGGDTEYGLVLTGTYIGV